MTSKNLIAMIFARGGSKGVLKKNIRMVGDKPLIAHSIECGLDSKYISRVVVSTDCNEIASVARKYGADVLMRPSKLAHDTTPELHAWRHAIDVQGDVFGKDKQDIFISIPATTPLRASEDIDDAIERYSMGHYDIVFAISPSQRNPYLNMVTLDEKHSIHIAIEGSNATRRQDVPDVFDITTSVYVTDVSYVQTCDRLIDGRVGGSIIPAERALDIDSEYDLHIADLLIKHPFKIRQ